VRWMRYRQGSVVRDAAQYGLDEMFKEILSSEASLVDFMPGSQLIPLKRSGKWQRNFGRIHCLQKMEIRQRVEVGVARGSRKQGYPSRKPLGTKLAGFDSRLLKVDARLKAEVEKQGRRDDDFLDDFLSMTMWLHEFPFY